MTTAEKAERKAEAIIEIMNLVKDYATCDDKDERDMFFQIMNKVRAVREIGA